MSEAERKLLGSKALSQSQGANSNNGSSNTWTSVTCVSNILNSNNVLQGKVLLLFFKCMWMKRLLIKKKNIYRSLSLSLSKNMFLLGSTLVKFFLYSPVFTTGKGVPHATPPHSATPHLISPHLTLITILFISGLSEWIQEPASKTGQTGFLRTTQRGSFCILVQAQDYLAFDGLGI